MPFTTSLVNVKREKMIEILRQLKKASNVIRTKTAERFFVFKQPNVQYQRKANWLEKQLTQSRIVSITIFWNCFLHFVK